MIVAHATDLFFVVVAVAHRTVFFQYYLHFTIIVAGDGSLLSTLHRKSSHGVIRQMCCQTPLTPHQSAESTLPHLLCLAQLTTRPGVCKLVLSRDVLV